MVREREREKMDFEPFLLGVQKKNSAKIKFKEMREREKKKACIERDFKKLKNLFFFIRTINQSNKNLGRTQELMQM